jgi:lipid II:glycine glycyltransferase (peptidoglycan interpeptide bridge formation enzyme)
LHVLGLAADPDDLLPTFSKSQVRRNIVRSEREGVVVRHAERKSDLVDIYYDLHLRTRQRLGVPIQPRRFFELLWDRLLASGLGWLLIAEHGGRPVAGAVFLEWNGTTIYKFGASEADSWSVRPNHAIFWRAIRESCANGSRALDFGRTELANEGLRAFKAGWGTVEHPLVYTTLGAAPSERGSGRLGAFLALTIRRSPRWVCRAMGETLYRYAA